MNYSFSKDLDPVDVADKLISLIEEGYVKKKDSYAKVAKLINKRGLDVTEQDIKELYTGKVKGYKQIIMSKLAEYEEVETEAEEEQKVVEKEDKKKEEKDLSEVQKNIETYQKVVDIENRLKFNKPVTEKEKTFYFNYKKEQKEKQKKQSLLKVEREKEEKEEDEDIEEEEPKRKIIRKRFVIKEKKEKEDEDEDKVDYEDYMRKQSELLEKQKRRILETKEEEELMKKEVEKKVRESIDEEEEEDEIIEIFTASGTKYIRRSKLEKKSGKEKEEPSPFVDLSKLDRQKMRKEVIESIYEPMLLKSLKDIDIEGLIVARKPADIIARKKQNFNAYQYARWILENPSAGKDANLSKINSLKLSPTLLSPFLDLDLVSRETFASSIIRKFENQKDMEIQTWTFYDELAKFLRNNKYKNSYRTKIRSSLLDEYREEGDPELDMLGDDIEDLVEEDEQEGDKEDDVVVEYKRSVGADNIYKLLEEFMDENTEKKQRYVTEMNDFIKVFLKWVYKYYPSSPSFSYALIRNSLVDIIGEDNVKTSKKNGETVSIIQNLRIINKLSREDEDKIKDARSFINLASTYDLKSKIYILFHINAYKQESLEDLTSLFEEYNEKLVKNTDNSFDEEFIEKYTELWKRNSGNNPVKRFMEITPFVQRYLKQSVKNIRNPLIQDPNRRKNRLRALNTEESVTEKFMSRLPYNISKTAKECLFWHQSKPWWNLNYSTDKVLIAHYDGISKEEMPAAYKQYFGDFVYQYMSGNKPMNFYSPSRLYNMLLCHLNYTEKDIVQCTPNDDDSITLSTPDGDLRVFTGVFNTSVKGDESFYVATKEMYQKECKWWKEQTYSPKVMMNTIKKLKIKEERREAFYLIRLFKEIAKSYLNVFYEYANKRFRNVSKLTEQGDIVIEKQEIASGELSAEDKKDIFYYSDIDLSKIANMLVDLLLEREDSNTTVSKFSMDFFSAIAPLVNSFYPSRILTMYRNLWKIKPSKIDRKFVESILDMPVEYRFFEVYYAPDIEKRDMMKNMLTKELEILVDEYLISFHNLYYTKRPHIKYLNGRKIGSVDDMQFDKLIKVFDVDTSASAYCENKFSESKRHIFVRGLMDEDGEQVEKVFCIDLMTIYNMHERDYEEEYYTYNLKISRNEFAEVYIPKQIVDIVYEQVREQLAADVDSFSFDGDFGEVELTCAYCRKIITSDDNIYKSYEQTQNEIGNTINTELVLYCSSKCFNKVNEKVPSIASQEVNYSFSSKSKLREKACEKFMLRIVNENKLDLQKMGYKSKAQLQRDIMSGSVDLERFREMVGRKTMDKYNNVMKYMLN